MLRRKTERWKFFFIALFAITMVGSSCEIIDVHADTTITSLPPWLEKVFEEQSVLANLTSDQMDQTRAIWVNQLNVNQKAIDSGSAQVTNDITYQDWMIVDLAEEQFNGGQMINGVNIVGQPDFNFARFYAPNYQAFACVVGLLGYSVAYNQNIYVNAKLGPTGQASNDGYFIAEVANNPQAPWQQWMQGFVGASQAITWPYVIPYGVDYFIGKVPSFNAPYSFICIGVYPGGIGSKTTYADVMGDAVGSDTS